MAAPTSLVPSSLQLHQQHFELLAAQLASVMPCQNQISNHITAPLSPPLTPTEQVIPFEDPCSAASSPSTLDHDDESNRSSPVPVEPISLNVRRISKPRRTHAKFSDLMEDRVISQSLSSQARSRYRKSAPQCRSSASAPIEGTVHFNIFEQYRRDPKALLLPAVVLAPVTRKKPSSVPFLPVELSTGGWDDPNTDITSFFPLLPSGPQHHSESLEDDICLDRRMSPMSDQEGDTSPSAFEVAGKLLESHLLPQPDMSVFDVRKPKVSWRGTPLDIRHHDFYDLLHQSEALIAGILRLTPTLYLKCRYTLLLAAREHAERGAPFRKSDAQKLCRVDVNKTSRLWEIFGELGWLGDDWPGL